jgi:hypothetical protein
MKTMSDYDLFFFDFFMFQSKRCWVGVKKNISVLEAMAIFKRENFLNIGKTGKL